MEPSFPPDRFNHHVRHRLFGQGTDLLADITVAIVDHGIGYENIDVDAATKAGIAVCNIPDYGTSEVAEHALAMALALARQLPQSDARLRRGEWSYVTPRPTVCFSDMTLATAGFGRIARALHREASAIGFRHIAFDPYLSSSVFAQAGVERVSIESLFEQADILSLHRPWRSHRRGGARRGASGGNPWRCRH